MKRDPMRDAWQIAIPSKDLRRAPASRTIAGTPVAVYRTTDGVAAMVDRCPHRNYPLSQGRVAGDSLVCPYHGWSFARNGACVSVPGCAVPADPQRRLAATPVDVVERDGAVFVRLEGDAAFPRFETPFGDDGFDHFWWDQGEWETTVFDAIENVMDPFHTTELHHGHIRNRDRRQDVKVAVENAVRGVTMTIEQSAPDHGFMARVFERNRTRSRSTFHPPVAFQGVWDGKGGVNIGVTVFFTPVDTGRIRPIACFSTPKSFLPGWFKERVIKAFIAPVIRQDREALRLQAGAIARFGSPRYAQGPGDPLGNRIRTLMDGGTLMPGITDTFRARL